ncbi:Rap1a/Tai family immunity protein [Ruegeria marina]|nr:Rap1a/Tai family immunity protein [Ruegeria marina]
MLVLATPGMVQPAHSGTGLTTGEYKATCALTDDGVPDFCVGYVQAVIDFASITGRACIPDGMPADDVSIVVEAATFDKIGTPGFPSSQPAVTMVLAAINSLFPCDR